MNLNIPQPEQQVGFSVLLAQSRTQFMQDALLDTVGNLNISDLDAQLRDYVPASALQALAKRGLRGELVFPVPMLLEANPYLLGYYRLLLGFSQKAFYSSDFGTSPFHSMEKKGRISPTCHDHIDTLCSSLVTSAEGLVKGLGDAMLSQELFDDLTLLTLGPQLRGGANVQLGAKAIAEVFDVIYDIVSHVASVTGKNNSITLQNAAGRAVLIEFAPDPDIIIREQMPGGTYRNIVAIEVKGGQDFSNIHNRIGEAEKSHQKARHDGYTECWTVVNVDRFDQQKAFTASPSTNRFYRISDLASRTGNEYEDFKGRILGITGIKSI